MTIAWSDDTTGIDWLELEQLYRLAPLGNKSAADLRTVFNNSRFKFFVRDGGKLVAAGRALSDGADCSYICDVAVLPGYQGQGLGKAIVTKLVVLSKGHKKIILYSVPGKEGFYRKLGFMRLLTAMAIFEDQPGAIAKGHLGES
ncbi:MAG TPA: GNAT family N-acetyltransferase [Usitatibacter sp.]|nr:GNAT family N-acetyltransferase [Usitatibacter sp.]